MKCTALRGIALGVAMAPLLCSQVAAGQEGSPIPEIRAIFEQELFELAYTVFLAGSKPADALGVAEKALKARPADAAWRKRAAQAADWSGHPEKALEHWAKLVDSGDAQAASRALMLARSLNDLRLLKLLIARQLPQGDQKLLQEYISLAEATGEPEEAIRVLEHPQPAWDTGFVLSEKARLYDLTGQPEKALADLEDLALLRPLTVAEAQRGASLWYGTGNPEKAWLLLIKASPTAAESETDFWEEVSDLGWALDHRKEAVSASDLLIKTDKARQLDYMRKVELYRRQGGRSGYEAATTGWRRFQDQFFLYALFEEGMSLGLWQELRQILNGLNVEQRRRFEGNTYFWTLSSQIYRRTGAPEKSLHASWQAVRNEPANGDVVAGHLWLLLEQGKTAEAQQVAEAWGGRAWRDQSLTDAVGAVYAALGDSRRALLYYRYSYASHRDDPAWLASYADLLEQSGRPEAGYLARFMAIKAMKTRKRQRFTAEQQKEMRNLAAQLQLLIHPGDHLDHLFRQIAAGNLDAAGRDLVTAWLLATEKHELGRLWLMQRYIRSSRKPAWAELSLALQENDLPAIEALLAKALTRLPYRDAVEAARRAGQTPTAETTAFERFQLNDRDHLLDKQLRDLYESHPSLLRYSLAVSDRGGVGMLEQQLTGQLSMNSRLWLKAELANTDFRHLKSGVLGSYVASKQRVLLGLGYRQESGKATLAAGLGDGLYRYPVTLLQADWRFNSLLTTDISLGYNSEALESVPLLIGGTKDEAALGLNWRLTGRDTLRIRTAVFIFHDQMRRYLGHGSSIDAELGHRVHVAWPDVTLRFFGGYHQYTANGTPAQKTAALIPRNAVKTAAFFIPAGFAQAGAGVALGQAWKETYSRNWKLFGAAEASWNSVSGSGFRYELGAAGPLFGLDTLLFFLSQESGSFGSIDLSTRIDLLYRYRFN